MYKSLYTILFFLFSISSNAQTYLSLEDGVKSTTPTEITPTRTVIPTNDGIIVTYEIKNAYLQEDELYKGTYWWKIDAFGYNEKLCQPAYPVRIDQFEIPYAKQAKLEYLDGEYHDIICRLTPARGPLVESWNEKYTFDNVPPITESDSWFPSQIVINENIQNYRGVNIMNVRISPIQYNSALGITRTYTKISYKLSFSSSQSNSESYNLPIIRPQDNFLSNITLNHSNNNKNKIADSPIKNNISYLIITTPKYETAAKEFCRWKKLLGFDTYTSIRDVWTTNSIKTEIKNAYNSLKNLYYVLLIGSYKDIPSKNCIFLENYVTDFYYGCVSGESDHMQDVYVGRIPVTSETEAKNTINKIISYEKNPVTDPTFYKNGMNCAYFEDDNSDGYEDRCFVQTAEHVRNYLLSKNKNICRVYTTESSVYPTNWNNIHFSNGEAIPSELLKSEFSWNGNASNISNEIHKGVFYILHRDHGSDIEWGKPNFNITDIKNLSNYNRLPIVFSINCLTGKFDSNKCFSEEFLKNPNGGCVAIIGASSYSLSGYNDVFTAGMFDAIWPDPGLIIRMPDHQTDTINPTPQPTYRLGQIIQQGLNRMHELYGVNGSHANYIKEIFHCFGDPSIVFPISAPTEFKNVKCVYDLNNITVSVDDDNAIITFFDKTSETIVSYNSSEATFNTSTPERISICVSGENKIPLILNGNDLVIIQNKTFNNDTKILANKVIMGSSLTDKTKFGPVVFKEGKIILKASCVEIHPQTSISKDADVTICFE